MRGRRYPIQAIGVAIRQACPAMGRDAQTYAKQLSMSVADVDTAAVLSVLKPHWQRVPETANRLRGRIEAVLDYAKAHGWRSGENPAAWRGHLALILSKRQKLERKHLEAMTWYEI
jgi:hypothetical protein